MFSIQKSLRLRFLSATTPVIVILIIGLFVSFDYFINHIIDDLTERFASQQVFYDRGRTLQPLLLEITLARKLARSQAIVDWALDEENSQNGARGLAELESFRTIFKDGSYFFAIRKSGHYFFNDAKNTYAGKQLRYTLSPNKLDDAWYYATLTNPTECQLNVNNDEALKVTKVWINCLVMQGDIAIGVIGTGIELSNFINSVLNARQDGVVNMFIDGDGAIQAHPDATYIDFASLTKDADAKNTVYQMLGDAASREHLKGLLHKIKAAPETIETTYLTINKQKTLVGIAYLKEIDWFNLTVMDPRVWALGQIFVPLAALMVVGMLLVLVFGAMVLHRIVLSRIGRLDSAIEKIKCNDYVLNLHDDSPDEIGRLTTSFVDMAGVVQMNRLELERKVTERTQDLVETRDKAQAADLAKTEFLATMSHELRTPLNAIIGFSEVMDQKMFGPLDAPQYEGYANDILNSGLHLLALINDILEISKIEAGKIELHRELIPFVPLISEAFIYVKGKSEEKGVSVVNAVSPDLPLFFGDKMAILQVLINLIVNGLKFTAEGGSVTITAKETAGHIKIMVTDTGVGIAPENIDQVMKPFTQVDRERHFKQEGTGLGLSLSKSLVELHGGTLSLESEVGKGTVVTIALPVTSRIGWYPLMSVGVTAFDSDHKKLMALIDQVVTAVRSGAVDGVVQSVVTRLADYSEVHFGAEEKVMDALGYPGAQGHKATHDAFRRWLGDLNGKLGSRQDEKVVAEISEYLGNWLLDHILIIDKEYHQFFKQRADQVSLLLLNYTGLPNISDQEPREH